MPELTQELQTIQQIIMLTGDLAGLTENQKILWYNFSCEKAGLDPSKLPFDWRTYEGKVVLATNKRGCAALRAIHGISIDSLTQTTVAGCVVFTATARDKNGRQEIETGAADITDLSGKEIQNAIMAATTRAKNRVTLATAGLGMLDESEITTAPAASAPIPTATPTIAVNNAPADVVEDTRPPAAVGQPFTPPIEQPKTNSAPSKFGGGLWAAVAEPTTVTAPVPAPVSVMQPVQIAPQPLPIEDIAARFDDEGVVQTHILLSENPMERAAALDPDPPAIHSIEEKPAETILQVAPQPQPAPENAPAPAAAPAPAVLTAVSNTPATRAEFEKFTARAAKIIRDVLPKGGLKNANDKVRELLLKSSGCAGLKDISAYSWETMLAVLEGATTPEAAVEIVKKGKL